MGAKTGLSSVDPASTNGNLDLLSSHDDRPDPAVVNILRYWRISMRWFRASFVEG